MTDRMIPVPESLVERFSSKVDFDGPDGCWLWTASCWPTGYGQYWHGGRVMRAHRFSYEALVGPIPEGLFLDHICSRRNCVNPKHLRFATNKQNLEHRAGATSRSKSGVRGVFWSKRKKKWAVQAKHNGKIYHAGYFANLDAADRAAQELRASLFTHDVRPPKGDH